MRALRLTRNCRVLSGGGAATGAVETSAATASALAWACGRARPLAPSINSCQHVRRCSTARPGGTRRRAAARRNAVERVVALVTLQNSGDHFGFDRTRRAAREHERKAPFDTTNGRASIEYHRDDAASRSRNRALRAVFLPIPSHPGKVGSEVNDLSGARGKRSGRPGINPKSFGDFALRPEGRRSESSHDVRPIVAPCGGGSRG